MRQLLLATFLLLTTTFAQERADTVSPNGDARATDELFEAFRNPDANARPWMRWWWNGNRISEAEIDRQLDAMAAQGVGGVEINPIALPEGSVEVGPEPVEWLSPGWNALVAYAVRGAKARGMLADLIVGSGWPFGGRFLEAEQQIQILRMMHRPLAAGEEHRVRLDELSNLPKQRAGSDFADDPPTRLAFLLRVPETPGRIEDVVDVSGLVTGSELVLPALPEPTFLSVGVVQTGFREVVHGAPGADGPVLDHFDAQAVRAYLERMSNQLGPMLGEQLGDGLRAMFCDSIELGGSNWTDDLRAEFRERRGYELEPWLPLILPDTRGGRRATPKPDAGFLDAVRRARHDFARTLSELFVERFVDTFCSWCREQGTLSRYQAYGIPWIYGMLEGYERPDIPEGDTWIHFPRDSVGKRLDGIRYAVWNKMASSAAHRMGRHVVAAEAMTNLNGVFKATLEDLKQAADLDFMTGVNHSILHGWNHSPQEAGFPGWVRYGTYFSDRNPWWRHFRRFSEYHARIAAVLQRTEPRAQVAILGPRADVWSDHGLDRVPLLGTPEWLFEIWQTFQQVGCVADYVTERDLREATLVDGRFVCGEMRYELVLLADVETLEPETAEALLRHVQAGGRVAITGRTPRRSPFGSTSNETDRRVREAFANLLEIDPTRAARVAVPGEDRIAWAVALTTRFEVTRPMTILDPDPYLFQVQHRLGEREVFFVANLHRDQPRTFRTRFASRNKTLWRWDPQHGGRRGLGPTGEREITLILGPLESALFVLEPEHAVVAPERPFPTPPITNELVATMTGPWQVHLEPIEGEPSTHTFPTLFDLASAEDPTLANFSGQLEYRIEVPASVILAARVLDLGTVHGVSEVLLGGRPIGTRWFGRHVHDLAPARRLNLEPRMELLVRVTTTAANHARTLDDAIARRWTRAWREKEPAGAGLVGPVRWMK